MLWSRCPCEYFLYRVSVTEMDNNIADVDFMLFVLFIDVDRNVKLFSLKHTEDALTSGKSSWRMRW